MFVIPALRRRPLSYPSTAPEREPAPSLASYRRPCMSPVSGRPGLIGAAWALPKRVPARGRGRETELFEGLRSAAGNSLSPALEGDVFDASVDAHWPCRTDRDSRAQRENDGSERLEGGDSHFVQLRAAIFAPCSQGMGRSLVSRRRGCFGCFDLAVDVRLVRW